MTTNHTNTSARRITAAALMVAAAGALAVGGLGAAATANAKPGIINPAPPAPPSQTRAPETASRYAAIALSSDGVWASLGSAPSYQAANTGALARCQFAGGIDCVLTGNAENECIALAVDAVDFEHWSIGLGPTKVSSQTAALQSNGGGRIAIVACTPAGPPMGSIGRVNEMRY